MSDPSPDRFSLLYRQQLFLNLGFELVFYGEGLFIRAVNRTNHDYRNSSDPCLAHLFLRV
jgi:hypothetical protein